MNLSDLYRDVIVDHNRNPRNRGRLECPTHHAEGDNPLCGDRLRLDVRLDGDVIGDLRFEGSGCAISTASASLMGEAVKGRTRCHVSRLAATAAAVIIAVASGHLNAIPLVGEYVELVLPQVPAAVRAVRSVIAETAATDRTDVARAGRSAALQPSQSRQRVKTAEPYELQEPYELDEPNGSHEPYEPGELSQASVPFLAARNFDGAYGRPGAGPDASNQPSDQSIRWSTAAAPGVGIARAARKTSVGLAGLDPSRISSCATEDYPTPARRPAYSVLASERLEDLGLEPLPHWRTSIWDVVDELKTWI